MEIQIPFSAPTSQQIRDEGLMFVIPGEPIAQKRPRLFRRGQHTMVYNPNHQQKRDVNQALVEQLIRYAKSPDPKIAKKASNLTSSDVFYVGVYLHSYPPIKNATKRFKNRVDWGLEDKTSKPDVDNCLKFFMDAAIGVLFQDDSQVISVYVQKQYSYNPRTEVYIMGKRKPLAATIGVLELLPRQFIQELSEIAAVAANCEEPQTVASIIYGFAKKYAPALMQITKIASPNL